MVVFTLPMFTRLNNFLLALFLVLCLIDILIFLKSFSLGSIFSRGWPVQMFFLLAILATLHDFDAESLKYLEKYLSFLLVPIAMLSDDETFSKRRNNIFLALVWGSVVTLLICYGATALEMVRDGESLDQLFQWHHTGIRFTDVADSHPTYLGLFIVTSILFLLQDNSLNRPLKFVMYVILILGLFQIASRTALLLLAIFLIFAIIKKTREYRLQLLVLIIGIISSVSLMVIVGKEYMEDRIFSVEAVTDSKRVERWEVSYEIFKEHPFIGVGYKKVKELRKEKYIERNLPISAETEYNAHNQLLEYLSTNGAFGGFVYVISLTFLLLLSLLKRDTLFTFIFLIFILANITESMMVRIKGIEFFAIFATLFLCSPSARNETYSNLNKVE